MTRGPFSVMQKNHVPPSGDKHDYMSQAPYFWPDPDKKDGLPYVRRDGKVNPERDKYDAPLLKKMSQAVATLALAYYLTGEERYAEHAAPGLAELDTMKHRLRAVPTPAQGQLAESDLEPGLVTDQLLERRAVLRYPGGGQLIGQRGDCSQNEQAAEHQARHTQRRARRPRNR